ANDPVGIALMIGMIELATHADASFWIVVREFAVEMAVGLAVGVAGGLLMVQAIRRVSFPSAGLYTLRGLAGAGIVYGVATVAHGSGFLAVFIFVVVLASVLLQGTTIPFAARRLGVRMHRLVPRAAPEAEPEPQS